MRGEEWKCKTGTKIRITIKITINNSVTERDDHCWRQHGKS